MASKLVHFALALCFSAEAEEACTKKFCQAEEADDVVAYMQRRVHRSDAADPFFAYKTAPSACDYGGLVSRSATPVEDLPFHHRGGRSVAVVSGAPFIDYRALVDELRGGGLEVQHIPDFTELGTLEARLGAAWTKKLGLLFFFAPDFSEVDAKYMKRLAHSGATVVHTTLTFAGHRQSARFFYDLAVTLNFDVPGCGGGSIVPALGADKRLVTKYIVKGVDELQTPAFSVVSHGELGKCIDEVRILHADPVGGTVDLIRQFGKGRVILGDGIMFSLGTCGASLTREHQRLVRNLWAGSLDIKPW